MPAQTIKVVPPALLAAAASVASASTKAATPAQGAVPMAVPGSPTDAALATIALGIATQTTQMSVDVSGDAAEVQAKTSSGVAKLQAQDEDNAAQIQAVSDGWDAPAQPHRIGEDWWEDEYGSFQPPVHLGGGGGASGGGSGTAPVGFKTSVGDDWGDPAVPHVIGPDWEEDEFGFFHPPVIHIDGGGAGYGL